MMWQDRVTRAQKHKQFTSDDLVKAGLWKFCAISENPKIMRQGAGVPYGTKAKELGLEFQNAVMHGWFYKAEKLLKQIQRLKQ